MLKRLGISLVALLALMVLIPAPQAQDAVRFGIGVGVPYPAYPAYSYGYPYGYGTLIRRAPMPTVIRTISRWRWLSRRPQIIPPNVFRPGRIEKNVNPPGLPAQLPDGGNATKR